MHADHSPIIPFPGHIPAEPPSPGEASGPPVEIKYSVHYAEAPLVQAMAAFCEAAYGKLAENTGVRLHHFEFFLDPGNTKALFKIFATPIDDVPAAAVAPVTVPSVALN